MVFINPIEILELKDIDANLIDTNAIRKAKRKLFAEIDLSDDGLLAYYDQKLTKSDCERAIYELDDSNKFEFYYQLATNLFLNSFLANGNIEFLKRPKQESIYKLPAFINFVSPFFTKKIDLLLLKAFQNNDLELLSSIIRFDYFIVKQDLHNAYRSLSNEIESRIIEIDSLTTKIKEGESSFTDENIESVLKIIQDKFPIELLNKLPQYFQSQINKIASSINYLQLNIWNEFDTTLVSLRLLEHLLSLNIESLKKPTFEKNFEIVKKSHEKKKEEEKIQFHKEKLLTSLQSFESKPQTTANARELIYQAKQYLFNLKSVMNGNEHTYLNLSTRVAAIAQSCIIFDTNSNLSQNSVLELWRVKHSLKNAWEVTQLIGSLEMNHDFIVNQFNPNKETLKSICDKYSVPTPQLLTAKLPKCNFVILDGIITHIDKDSKPLPITNPFIRSELRYIGLNLKIEAFINQSLKFYMKYIQPNGTLSAGTSSPEGFSFSIDKTINTFSGTINLSGWGASDSSIFDVGTHHIEVWLENSMIYRKSFVVDWSPIEKIANAKKEKERLEQLKIEAEKRKEQVRIKEQKVKEKKVRNICLLIMGIFIGIALIFSIWGTEGLETAGSIAIVFGLLFGFGIIRVLSEKR